MSVSLGFWGLGLYGGFMSKVGENPSKMHIKQLVKLWQYVLK